MIITFFGGPLDGGRACLVDLPSTVRISGDLYERPDDPDTHEPLGVYVYRRPDESESRDA